MLTVHVLVPRVKKCITAYQAVVQNLCLYAWVFKYNFRQNVFLSALTDFTQTLLNQVETEAKYDTRSSHRCQGQPLQCYKYGYAIYDYNNIETSVQSP